MRLRTAHVCEYSSSRLKVQAQAQELSICINKTCKKQGSAQVGPFWLTE
jgi:hypothetical protein